MNVERITVFKADNGPNKDIKKDKGINYQVQLENDDTDDFNEVFEGELRRLNNGKLNGVRKV